MPGDRLTAMTDSDGSLGFKSTGRTLGISGIQLSFEAIISPAALCSSRTGSAKTVWTPWAAKEGPSARMTIFLLAFPEMINPPIIALSPLCTSTRVEMLRRYLGGGGGVGDGVGVGPGSTFNSESIEARSGA